MYGRMARTMSIDEYGSVGGLAAEQFVRVQDMCVRVCERSQRHGHGGRGDAHSNTSNCWFLSHYPIYRSPLPNTYALSSLHRLPESYRPVTSAPSVCEYGLEKMSRGRGDRTERLRVPVQE